MSHSGASTVYVATAATGVARRGPAAAFPFWDEECRGWSGTWGGRIREDPRGSERLGEREGGVRVELKPRAGDRGARGNSGLSRVSVADVVAAAPVQIATKIFLDQQIATKSP